MPNRRISELDESGPLYFNDVSFNSIYTESESEGSSSDWFLMTANPKISNNKISIPNFQRSVVTDTLYLNGAQRISGQKTFADPCHITKRANITSIQDPSVDGALSGVGLVGATGLFGSIVAGTGYSEQFLDQELSIFDTALCGGNLKIQGTIYTTQDFSTDSDFNCEDIISTSSANISGAIESSGNFFTNENLIIANNFEALNDLESSGQLNINQNISFVNNSNISLESGRLQITSGTNNFIDISQDNIKYKEIINVNQSNVVNLSDSTPSGTFHVDGTGYVQNINALNNGTYRQFFGGDDESMIFANALQSGFRDFTIDLPKTFLETPIISATVQHVSGGFIVPYVLSDITNKNYKIKFSADINDDNFILHTTAMAPSSGKYSSNKKGIQRFRTIIPSGTSSQQISFPEPHTLKPTINITIEAENEIIPHAISGVNTSNYTLFLATESTQEYILHTISTEIDNQRIS